MISGALRPTDAQPFGDRDERPRVLVRRRRIHQHRRAALADHPEIAAERGVAGKRLDPRSGPAAGCEEFGRMRGRNHRGGHRPSHDGGTWAVKRRAPASREVERQAERIRPGVLARRARAIRPAARASSAASRPSSSSSDAILDPVEVDMPHRRVERFIGLDDREARARHLALMAERGEEAPRQRRLADAERPGQRDDVAGPRKRGQLRAERGRFLFVCEDHCAPRGTRQRDRGALALLRTRARPCRHAPR